MTLWAAGAVLHTSLVHTCFHLWIIGVEPSRLIGEASYDMRMTKEVMGTHLSRNNPHQQGGETLSPGGMKPGA